MNRLIIGIGVLFLCLRPAFAEQMHLISFYGDRTGMVSVVAEVPVGLSLDPLQFQLLEDGEATVSASAVRSIRDSRWRLAQVICVDTSGSMKRAPLSETRTALKNLLESDFFSSEDQVALIAFETEPRISQWFVSLKGRPKEELLQKVDNLEWLGTQNTVLYDALFESLGHLQTLQMPAPVLKRVLLVSDGIDENSAKNANDVETSARKLGVAVDVVARVRKDKVNEDIRKGHVQKLHALADKTGGKFAYAEPGNVLKAINAITKGLKAIRVIEFSRNIETDGSDTHEIGIRWKGPDQDSFEDKILAKIPRTRQPTVWIWWWLLLPAVLALYLIKRIVFPPKPPDDDSEITEGESTQTDNAETDAQIVRETVVGGSVFPAPAAGKPTAVLQGVEGPAQGQAYRVEKSVVDIGAGDENDIDLAEDDFVSAQHAYLRYEEGSLFLFDKGSLNGTFVNGQPVVDTAVSLRIGDQIQFGSSVFRLEKTSN